jgi:hypothetical protein
MELSGNLTLMLTIGAGSLSLVMVCLLVADYILRIMDALGL